MVKRRAIQRINITWEEGDILFLFQGAKQYAVVFQCSEQLRIVTLPPLLCLVYVWIKTRPFLICGMESINPNRILLESQATGTYTASINEENCRIVPIISSITF